MPSAGPDSWKQFLAQPDLHWARGYSGRTLAHAWEAADGLPSEVDSLFYDALGPAELLVAIPERKTAIPGGSRESQSDVFALVRAEIGLVACTIEGKVDEPFGPTVAEWLVNASYGKTKRLDYILELLGLQGCPGEISYQLLHRTAAALIEAEAFAAAAAAMIVHSFSPSNRWFDEFQKFIGLFEALATIGAPTTVRVPGGRELILGWAAGDQRYRSS